MSPRRVLFWIHLSMGLAISLVLGFLAVTGLLLAAQDTVTSLLERSVVVPSPAPTCVSFSEVVQNARRASKSMGISVTLFADPTAPELFTVSNDTVYLLNPCDGTLLRPTPSPARAFFSHVKDLHRWVAFGGSLHEGLRSIKDAVNLVFPLMLLSGIVLWLPRSWTRTSLRAVSLPRAGLRGRAREWNWHNVAGLWALIPLLSISLTGTIMAYGWATDSLYRLAGSPPPKAAEERVPMRTASNLAYIDALIPLAQQQDTHWRAIAIRLPQDADKSVSFTIDDRLDNEPSGRNLLTLSRKGKVVRWEPFYALPRGRQWRLDARFLHSGDLFGLPGRVVVVFSAFALLLLIATGMLLSLRRLMAWRQRVARQHRTKRSRQSPQVSHEGLL